MDPILIGIIAIPILISLFCKFALKWDISLVEFAAQALAGTLALTLIWAAGSQLAGLDKEVLNGQVTGKHAWRFSCPTNTGNPCRNGYSCNCRKVCSGSGENKSCSTTCDTCYRYGWEQNWYVDTDLPNKSQIEIDRIDDQGAYMPGRYEIVRTGDPASSTHYYKNWIKASAASLFREDEQALERYKALMVEYPIDVDDYYRVDRIVTPNFQLRNEARWNLELAKALRTLGPKQQMNAVIVIANNVDRDYAFGLRRHWAGFKKNDAVIVIGLRNGVIQWSEVMSWSKTSLFNIELRNGIEDLQGQQIAAIDPNTITHQLTTYGVKSFVRRPMKEFEYLKGDIPAPTWLIVLSLVLSVAFGVSTSVWFHNIDITQLGNGSYRFNSRRFRP